MPELTRKIPLSPRAVRYRLDRLLRKKGFLLMKTQRHATARGALGEYYLVNAETMELHRDHLTLSGLALEFGALRPYEEVQCP
jgi:hypothetical protein